ncbi:MAG: T9SS type A sorting domain-containing protein, partial [Bacteroidetes bacterium]|nr:T9SS type A sorting domain-containing protein [Bacteroidota bacterium]
GTGSYRVRVTNAAGCDAWSDPIAVTVLGVEGNAQPVAGDFIRGFESWPNPVAGVLTVDVRLGAASTSELSLHDLLGREVWRFARATQDSGYTQRFDVSALRPGLYLLRLHAGGETRSRMLLLR